MSYDSPRTILCDDCSDVALEYDPRMVAEELEGRECQCESCGVAGKVYLIEDEEYGYGGDLRFRPMTEFELSCDPGRDE